MASSSHTLHNQNNNQPNNVVMNISCASPSSNNNNSTTFVQADPSNFRSIVQKLTGHDESSCHPIGKSNYGKKGPPQRSIFKLHERRHSARKLENIFTNKILSSPNYSTSRQRSNFLASPVFPLEMMTRGISPRSPMEEEKEEERAIAGKGFYLHPSTPRGSQPPQLLPLFPLQSPTATHHSSS
ncbi:VQ motif-containing protein 11-like [Lycium barbarum]|uniref:VQ motif-containing protein 11-like n=1 Tax=Lycium barbarum TaxID=112863 RepID=UPI00293E8F8C|nr:VQ motif-containing protein 11-like [Lycium barbarum]